MSRDFKFWTALGVFQIVFGSSVFAVTRYYYRSEAPRSINSAKATLATPSPWPDVSRMPLAAPAPANSIALTDPALISSHADEFFESGEYDKAAELYSELLALDSGNVDVYNNLGLTLQYLGRSEEALQKLAEGVALSPTHQRIWLTTGFVNLQLGNVTQAREALIRATEGNDLQVRESAQKMLQGLP